MQYLTSKSLEFIKRYAPSHIFWLKDDSIKWPIALRVLQEQCIFVDHRQHNGAELEQNIAHTYTQILQEALTTNQLTDTEKSNLHQQIGGRYLHSQHKDIKAQWIGWLKQHHRNQISIFKNALNALEILYVAGHVKEHIHIQTFDDTSPILLEHIPLKKLQNHFFESAFVDLENHQDRAVKWFLQLYRKGKNAKFKKYIKGIIAKRDRAIASDETLKYYTPTKDDHPDYIGAWIVFSRWNLSKIERVSLEDQSYVLRTAIQQAHQYGMIHAFNNLSRWKNELTQWIIEDPKIWEILQHGISITDLPEAAKYIPHEYHENIISTIRHSIGNIEFLAKCPTEIREKCFKMTHIQTNILCTALALDHDLDGFWNIGYLNNRHRSKCTLLLMELFPDYAEEIADVYSDQKNPRTVLNKIFHQLTGIENVYTVFQLGHSLGIFHDEQSSRNSQTNYDPHQTLMPMILDYAQKTLAQPLALDLIHDLA